MREIVHLQAGQCGNQVGAKVSIKIFLSRIKLLQRVLSVQKQINGLRIKSFFKNRK